MHTNAASHTTIQIIMLSSLKLFKVIKSIIFENKNMDLIITSYMPFPNYNNLNWYY